ncbi:MAG TPA: hypothetical protein VMW33_06890 [Ilumatobacteraceae bacterium]|jgi:carotenoid cleavage dioxygenase-like enzyme|nr:hypothetical protein [Ilumatobacteraceae bacterium]
MASHWPDLVDHVQYVVVGPDGRVSKVIDPVAKRVFETRLDDRPQEFPRHDPRVGLQRHRFGYTSEVGVGGPNLTGESRQ